MILWMSTAAKVVGISAQIHHSHLKKSPENLTEGKMDHQKWTVIEYGLLKIKISKIQYVATNLFMFSLIGMETIMIVLTCQITFMPLSLSFDNPHKRPNLDWQLRLMTTREILVSIRTQDQLKLSINPWNLFNLGHIIDVCPSYGFGMDQVTCHGTCSRKGCTST